MIKARLLKSQRLEDGSVSYMLKGPGEDKAMRHAAIDLEGEDVEINKARTGDQAIVQHPAEVVLSNTIDAAEELVTVLKNAYHMIKDAGSRGEALPNFDAKAEKVNNDLSSAVTVASDGPGPLEIILETEGEENE